MNECEIISCCNQKGGVAKTTTNNALALGLARKGYKVLAIDLDPQGNFSMSMGVSFTDQQEHTIASLMLQRLQGKKTKLDERYIQRNFEVDFVVGDDDLGKVGRMLSGFRDSEYIMEEILSEVKDKYLPIIYSIISKTFGM